MDLQAKSNLGLQVGHFDPEFKDAVLKQVEALGLLRQNWDSYGAHPIDRNIIADAVNFVRSLPDHIASRPRVVPMSTGNFQFEWHDEPKILELEFETPGTIHYLKWDASQQFSEEDTIGVNEIDRAVELIQWFMNGKGA